LVNEYKLHMRSAMMQSTSQRTRVGNALTRLQFATLNAANAPHRHIPAFGQWKYSEAPFKLREGMVDEALCFFFHRGACPIHLRYVRESRSDGSAVWANGHGADATLGR
jgi:hypothetical protein